VAQIVPPPPRLQVENFTEAMQLARMLAPSTMIPVHLRDRPADILLVIMQAQRWEMDPFALMQEMSIIAGRPMYSGKVVAAVVQTRGRLQSRLQYDYSGSGDDRAVTVSGLLQGETEPRTVTVRLRDARTTNKVWQTQPDQQLAYHGARVWARRYVPELMLGIYSEEEFDAPPPKAKTAGTADLPKDITPSKPVNTFRLEGLDQEFASTGRGWLAALDAIANGDTARLALLNAAFLDRAGERFPEPVADIRAKARAALEPPAEDLTDEALGIPDDFLPGGPTATPVTYDPETGEVVEDDRIAQKVAERRGAAPLDGTPEPDEFPG
jgi:hypothetical protein